MTLAHPIAIRTLVAARSSCRSPGLAACSRPPRARRRPRSTHGPRRSLVHRRPRPPASVSPSAVASEAASTRPGPTAVPTSIDPCQLVTPAEVSALDGLELRRRRAVHRGNNDRICGYGQEGSWSRCSCQWPRRGDGEGRRSRRSRRPRGGGCRGGIANTKLTEMPDFEPGVDAAVVEWQRRRGSEGHGHRAVRAEGRGDRRAERHRARRIGADECRDAGPRRGSPWPTAPDLNHRGAAPRRPEPPQAYRPRTKIRAARPIGTVRVTQGEYMSRAYIGA